MKNFQLFVIVLILTLAGAVGGFMMTKNAKPLVNQDNFNTVIGAIEGQKDLLKSSTLAFEVLDPDNGGVMQVQRAQAENDLTDKIIFDNDYADNFTISSPNKDTLKIESKAELKGDIRLCDSEKTLDKDHSIKYNELLFKHKGIPKIIPNSDEIQKQMLLGLCSMKDSLVEKKIMNKSEVDYKAFLTAIFNGTPVDGKETDAKTYKGCIGLQLVNPMLIEKTVGQKSAKLRDVVFYEICEVKSEQDMKKELEGLKLSEEELNDVIKGLRYLKEGEIVAIPQVTKNLIYGQDKVGVFTRAGRLARF